jgi:general secretion pathway protein L
MNNPTSPAIQTTADFQPGDFLRAVAASLRQLHAHPALAWITPQLPVRLIQADGGESLWLGERRVEASEAGLRSARFSAVEVPSDLVLTRSRMLPPLSGGDLRDAVALEVRDSSPFEPADLVWGYRASRADAAQLAVTTAIASRRQVGEHIAQVAPAADAGHPVEAWVLADGAPVVLQGFGEAARARSARNGRWLAWGLILVALLLAAAIAVTPTVRLHLRAAQAAAAYQALQQRAGPALAQRDELVRGREDLANLQEVMKDHVEPLVAIDVLTQLVPDDTWLARVQAQGNRFTLTGQTPNAAALMNTLSSNPGLRDVAAPTPATRAAGANRENFVVEFTVTPAMLRRPAAAGAPPAAVAAAPAAVAAAPAAAPASQAAMPAASAPARSQP